MAKFVIFKGSNQQYYFHLKADNYEKVLSGEGYLSKDSCLTGISSVKTNAPYNSQYERKESNAGYSFVLKAGNGLVIGKSEVYVSSQGRDNGIEVVKKIAPSASIEDQTTASSS